MVRDEFRNRLAEDRDRTVLALTVVAASFPTLGLVTGVLGVNPGGMPGARTPRAVAALCGPMPILAGLGPIPFRCLKWI